MRRRLPSLASCEDSFLLGTPLDTLLKMEEQAVLRRRLEKALPFEDKLSSNQDSLFSAETPVEAGVDNRSSKVHPARFLGGVARSGPDMWLMARSHIGREGHPPISNYDMACVGLTGHVSARGWMEIHNPGSKSLQLKLFSLSNAANKASAAKRFAINDEDDCLEVGESMRDIQEFGEFKEAIRALREAMVVVMPTNRSISAIEGFLVASNYCQEDLGAYGNGAAILTKFVDHVLNLNAEAWRNKQPFLTATDLVTTWKVWLGSRLSSLRTEAKASRPTQQGQPQKKKAGGPAGQQQQQQQKRITGPADICRKWNLGTCNNQANNCTTMKGLKLRHVCNYVYPNGNECGQNHRRPTFTH